MRGDEVLALRADVIITDELPVILQTLRVTVVTVGVIMIASVERSWLGYEAVLTALMTFDEVCQECSSLQTHSVSVRERSPHTVATH